MNLQQNQTLALAALFQAEVETDSLASDGFCDSSALDCSLASLFRIEVESTEAIYGNTAGLSRGLSALVEFLGGQSPSSGRIISYYVLSMLKLSRALLRDEAAAQDLLEGLRQIDSAARDFGLERGTIVARVDGLYQRCISGLQPRIMVRGEANFLRDENTAARVRTLLLAGIRAGVLWHQLGGSRWRLLWSRRVYVDTARAFLRRHQNA